MIGLWLGIAAAAAAGRGDGEVVRWQVDTSTSPAGRTALAYDVGPKGRLELHHPGLGLLRLVGPGRVRIGPGRVELQRGRAWILTDRAGTLHVRDQAVDLTPGGSVWIDVGRAGALSVYVHDGGARVAGRDVGLGQVFVQKPGGDPRVVASDGVLLDVVRDEYGSDPAVDFVLDRGLQGDTGRVFPRRPEWLGEERLFGASSVFDVLRERAVRPSPFSPERILGDGP